MSLARYIENIAVIFEIEFRKIIHQPSELLFRSVQPILWLLMFGQVIAHQLQSNNNTNYLNFLTPGILSQSVLFIAIFNGIAVIWERDMGVIQKILVAPIARSSIIIGKGLGAGVRAISQLIVVYVIALFLQVDINWSPIALIMVTFIVLLGAMLFSTFSLIIACIVKTRERFMGIGQFLAMPLFFASNAIYPTSAMPHWLKILAHINPLTYQVDALRAIMLQGTSSAYGLGLDLLIMLIISTVFIWVGTWLYPTLAR